VGAGSNQCTLGSGVVHILQREQNVAWPDGGWLHAACNPGLIVFQGQPLPVGGMPGRNQARLGQNMTLGLSNQGSLPLCTPGKSSTC
jgi:hypothetical protein